MVVLSAAACAEQRRFSAGKGSGSLSLLHGLVGDVVDNLWCSGNRPVIAGQSLNHRLDLLAAVIRGVGQPQTRLPDRNRRKGSEIQVKTIIHHPPAEFEGLARPTDSHEPEWGGIRVDHGETRRQETRPHRLDLMVENGLSLLQLGR